MTRPRSKLYRERIREKRKGNMKSRTYYEKKQETKWNGREALRVRVGGGQPAKRVTPADSGISSQVGAQARQGRQAGGRWRGRCVWGGRTDGTRAGLLLILTVDVPHTHASWALKSPHYSLSVEPTARDEY